MQFSGNLGGTLYTLRHQEQQIAVCTKLTTGSQQLL